jgi:hypothetical protein
VYTCGVPEVLQIYDPGNPQYRIRAGADLTILATDESPDVLELAVGLEPDEKWAQGDPFGKGGRRPYTGIRYASRLDEKQSPSDHVADLLHRLRPHVAGIAAVSRQAATYGLTVWVVEHTRSDDRQIDVEPEDLEAIAAMGLACQSTSISTVTKTTSYFRGVAGSRRRCAAGPLTRR